MGSRIWRGNKEVVHIDNELFFSNHILEGVVHGLLESSRRVVEAEEHDCQFKEPFVSDEGYFPLMAVFDLDVVVAPLNVKLDEVMSIFQLVHKVRDKREGVCISGGILI